MTEEIHRHRATQGAAVGRDAYRQDTVQPHIGPSILLGYPRIPILGRFLISSRSAFLLVVRVLRRLIGEDSLRRKRKKIWEGWEESSERIPR